MSRERKISYVLAPKNFPFYIITDKTLGKPIGFFGLKDNEILGLFIEPKYRRKGYATELLKLLVEENPDIVIVTNPKNISMQKILDNLGWSKWFKYHSTIGVEK